MPPIGVESWFPEGCTQAFAAVSSTAYLYLAVVFFLLNIAVPAIVKDYVVRWWRRWIHSDEFDRASKKLVKAEEALAAERAEFEATRSAIEQFLPQNDRLRLEITALRAQLRALESTNLKPDE